ncbi:MAG: threonine synthase [Spirochaetota bacterium]
MHYTCSLCHRSSPVAPTLFRCGCGGFFLAGQGRIFPREAPGGREAAIWRFREAYGLPEDLKPVSLGEGRTPLLPATVDGTGLLFKLDFLQPTGSFKDRGASVLISVVKTLGVKKVIEDSSGNAGAAVAAYCAAAGIGCTVFVPGYTPEEKLIQIRIYGARVVKVPGTRQDAHEAAVQASRRTFYASHLWSPFFAQGIRSAAFEIWEELGERAPSLVVAPLGSGGLVEGLFEGFRMLHQAGYAAKVPALVGVQAEHCSPIHTAFTTGLEDYAEVDTRSTVAEGISVQRPPRARAVLKALRESSGRTLSVTEEEILQALRELVSLGLYVEPTSAAALAGWRRLPAREQEGAVVVLTGHGLKEPTKLGTLLLQAG